MFFCKQSFVFGHLFTNIHINDFFIYNCLSTRIEIFFIYKSSIFIIFLKEEYCERIRISFYLL